MQNFAIILLNLHSQSDSSEFVEAERFVSSL